MLVCEPIAEAGVQLLSERFRVDLGLDWTPEQLAERVGDYDALVVRSATKVTAELIARADRLKVVGRAGTGVDNVDVAAATRRGIVVCNAAGSNALSAAEHAIALMLVPGAQHPAGPREPGSGAVGALEVRRHRGDRQDPGRPRLRPHRADGRRARQGPRAWWWWPTTPSSPRAATGSWASRRRDTPEALYGVSDFISLHLASTAETLGFVGREAFAAMKPGARLINAARGDVVDQDALLEALGSGHLAGAGIDVFPEEPVTESPLFGLPGVVVTPAPGRLHLRGPGPCRRGGRRAGGRRPHRRRRHLGGEHPGARAEVAEVIGPFLPLARQLGRLVGAMSGGAISPLEIIYEGGLAALDTRILTSAVLTGVLSGHVEESVNLVNAGSLAAERGIEWKRDHHAAGPRLHQPALPAHARREPRRHDGGHHLAPAPGVGLRPGHRDRARAPRGDLPLPRRPGQIGRVGTILGLAQINIASMAVSRSRAEGGP